MSLNRFPQIRICGDEKMRQLLKDFAMIGAGQGAPQGDSNYCDDGIPFVKAGNLQELLEGKPITEIQKVSDEVAKKHKLKLYPKGTILFAKSGMSCMKGYVYVLPQDSYVVCHLACVTPNNEDISDYLKYYFNYHKPNQLVKDAAYPSISLSDIENLAIDIKPDSERNDIVSQLQHIETVISLRQKQLQKLDDLIKARFVEMFGDPQSNPHGYKYAKLADIAIYFNGLTYKPENVAEEGTIVLRSSNIQNSQLDFADTVRVDCAIKERLMVQENDILMCSRNGSAKLVGKVALIKGIQEPMSFGAFMMIIRSQYFGYLMTYFQLDAFRQQIKTGATTTINQITGRMLDEVTIPVPPMALVEQFAAFVEQTDKSKFVVAKMIDIAQSNI